MNQHEFDQALAMADLLSRYGDAVCRASIEFAIAHGVGVFAAIAASDAAQRALGDILKGGACWSDVPIPSRPKPR